ncbi:MAG: DUF4157 domain-containing protein [Thermoanaerobaculia bacterium]|nr:DUF4157 domain-containing protein [Thermoanaerobaculia bacterium]
MTRAVAAPAAKRETRPPESASPAEKSTGEPGWAGLTLAGGALLQRKLRLGAVDDPLEREADRVAEAVVSAPAVGASRRSFSPIPAVTPTKAPGAQRCACEQCDCEEEPQMAQLAPLPGYFEPPRAAVPGVTGAGHPLEPALRADLEPKFGVDLGAVRLHTGGEAARAARELNARAFTVGRDIVFGASEFRPDTTGGRRLLAHELTHVLQQAAGRAGNAASVQRSVADSAGSNYDIGDTIFVLRQSLRVALRTLGDTAIPAARRAKIQTQFNRLQPLLPRLEAARSRDGRGVTFGFDSDPAQNEVIPGDSTKSLAELYAGFMDPPTPQATTAAASPELQAWALPGGLRITPYFGGDPQRCEIICVGVIILAGLLLAGCRSEQASADRDTPCTSAETTEIETFHNEGLAWVNLAVTRLAAYRGGTASAEVRGWVEAALNANFHSTHSSTVESVANRLTTLQTRMAAGATAANYRCQCRGNADAYTLGIGSSAQIHFCARWFRSTDRIRRITTVIHENGHATGLDGSVPITSGRIEDIYEFQDAYRTMTTQQALTNPDPFAVFVRQVANDGREPPGTHR